MSRLGAAFDLQNRVRSFGSMVVAMKVVFLERAFLLQVLVSLVVPVVE